MDQPAPENYEDLLEDFTRISLPPPRTRCCKEPSSGHRQRRDRRFRLQVRRPGSHRTVSEARRRSHRAAGRRGRCDDRSAASSPKAMSCFRTRAPRACASGTTWKRPTRNNWSSPAACWAASRAGWRWMWESRPSCPARRPTRARCITWIPWWARISRSKSSSSTAAAATWWSRARLAVEEEINVAQERHAGTPGGRRGGHRRGQEPDRLRRLHRPGRHRRPAARYRYFLRAASRILRKCCTWARRSRSRCSNSTAPRSASRWA